MFYVSGTKIYLAEMDAEKHIYPEVKLVLGPEGTPVPQVLSTGTSKKPRKRALCTLAEVIAQFGANAGAAEEV
jgi:hypothetical protein